MYSFSVVVIIITITIIMIAHSYIAHHPMLNKFKSPLN